MCCPFLNVLGSRSNRLHVVVMAPAWGGPGVLQGSGGSHACRALLRRSHPAAAAAAAGEREPARRLWAALRWRFRTRRLTGAAGGSGRGILAARPAEHCGLREKPAQICLLARARGRAGRGAGSCCSAARCMGAEEMPPPPYLDYAASRRRSGSLSVEISVVVGESSRRRRYASPARRRRSICRGASPAATSATTFTSLSSSAAQVSGARSDVPGLRLPPPSLCRAAAKAFDVETVRRCMLALVRLGPYNMVILGSSAWWCRVLLPIGGGMGGT